MAGGVAVGGAGVGVNVGGATRVHVGAMAGDASNIAPPVLLIKATIKINALKPIHP